MTVAHEVKVLSDQIKLRDNKIKMVLTRINEIDQIIASYDAKGIASYSPYMLGIINGLIFARAILDQGPPDYRPAPKTWLCELQGKNPGRELAYTEPKQPAVFDAPRETPKDTP